MEEKYNNFHYTELRFMDMNINKYLTYNKFKKGLIMSDYLSRKIGLIK